VNLGAPELLIVFAVVLLVFGGAKLPSLARSLGEARREFERGVGQPPTPIPIPVRVDDHTPRARRTDR
jgi:sec-independent protein translocase protein TatA